MSQNKRRNKGAGERRRWRNGEMERWRDGKMERWKDGEIGKWAKMPLASSPDALVQRDGNNPPVKKG
jgi:hypothetical protein